MEAYLSTLYQLGVVQPSLGVCEAYYYYYYYYYATSRNFLSLAHAHFAHSAIYEHTILTNVHQKHLLPTFSPISAGRTLKYKDAYRSYIRKRENLNIQYLKLLFLGPPRLGKTTARRRLTGKITDLRSAGEADRPQPSTGAVESGGNIVVRSLSASTAVITEDSEWFHLKNQPDEAMSLFHFIVEDYENKTKPDCAAPNCTPSSRPASTVREHTVSRPTAQEHRQSGTPNVSATPSAPSPAAPVSSSQPQDIPEVVEVFTKAMTSKHWEDVKPMLKAFLRMEDTGGQPELMDMLPVLSMGSALYLIFVNLEEDLQSLLKLSHCSLSGESTATVESNYTTEEIILSALSSIACSNSRTSEEANDPGGVSSEEINDPELKRILEISKSVAYIVGTHKDKVSEQDIDKFDQQLQDIIKSTDFFKKGLVQFSSENQLVLPMDNMDGGAEEIKRIRKLLGAAMEKHFKKLTIPAIWFLFSICLRRNEEKRTTSLEFCLKLSEKFQMSPHEMKTALWFLHHHAGVMMYFPKVEGLEDLVILDPQVVYDSVTELILRALRFEKVGKAVSERFKKTGQFTLEDLKAAIGSSDSGDLIKPEKLLVLLKYLCIIATICHEGKSDTYIMPCVLESASTAELDSYQEDKRHPVSLEPIMVRYECGSVPIGVFPAMIACLISNKSLKLIENGVKKNRVQFHFGTDYDKITFIARPKYYEIRMARMSKTKLPHHEVCMALRKEVESTFTTVSSHMNYGCFMDYEFSFECPSHPGREHLCVVEREDPSPHKMCCLENQDQLEPIDMEDSHLVWYGQVGGFLCSIRQLL